MTSMPKNEDLSEILVKLCVKLKSTKKVNSAEIGNDISLLYIIGTNISLSVTFSKIVCRISYPSLTFF